MPKIVLLDPLSEDGIKLLDAAQGIEYEERLGLKGEELRKTLAEFDGAICRSGVKITADALEGNKRLRAIARAGVGVDNIDTTAATRAGIIVMNTPGGNTVSTAEQAFALLLAMSRNIHPAYQALVEGRWDRKQYTGTQVAGKTLGIVGMGRIGQVVAKFAKAFDMKVLAFDPFLTPQKANELGVTLVESVHEMLPHVDYLTVHTPLNDATRGLFGKKELEMIKPGARLINCARGGIFDRDTLVEGMKSGKLGGVALDVYEEEPCTQHPLFGMKNVVCTPHLGASTEEAQTNVAVEAVELLIDFFTNGTIRQAVNFAPLDPETLKGLRAFLDLSYRLGMLSSQVSKGSLKNVRMKYKGEVARKDTSLLSAAFASGLMSSAMEQDVNIVGATSLMNERGIDLVEEKSYEVGDFGSLITAELTTDFGTLSLGGTVFGNSMPRLVIVNSFRLESYLDGNLLFFFHKDRPGVIGSVGNAFGKHQINIANMSLGREHAKPGCDAIGILALDVPAPGEAIQEVLSIEGISRVANAKLPPADQSPSWMR
ncbi:MAG: phosphoglycerate dehydrogenase [Thermoguttaceae bacterium]